MARLWFRSALLPEGWAEGVALDVREGRIAALESGVPARPGDETGGIALPGLPNLHSHAFQRAMAGLAECRSGHEDSFWTWREVMYRFVARMAPEDVEAVAAQAYVEMLEAGFTWVGEFHYLHHAPDGRAYADPAEMAGRIAAAAAEAGIGLTLLPVFYAHGGFGPGQGAPALPPTAGQRRFVSDPETFAAVMAGSRRAVADLRDCVVGLAPHSLRAATLAEIAAILPLAEGGPVHIHAAEQLREVEECRAATGARPVELLLDAAPVDARWCLIHATHMTPSETRGLARSGAVAGLCPITEANLGDGLFPLAAFQGAGGRFGIGSDSNVLIAAAEELRLLEYGQRLAGRVRGVATSARSASTGRALIEAALAGGGQALGRPAGLAPGQPADIVALDPDHPALAERSGDAWLDGFVFAARAGAIDRVWRAGARVVAQGRHHRREAVAARFRAALARLAA
ncbi:formiminoglutamate deiminase [Methylobacterium sp. 4-46]|uniref:formimidoylglutamate deiminase n=1 Tax=unclassified Methylobacterium TaxID=2615210 RepID=UPI000152CB4D|nr:MULTISPECIES: formimidoylglutamate deiminase [Methylobacterium]ACA16148.1 formiminoglutamate deiminase [Methylobacterium sp. 4-46]WFT81857.1 formimidoylglutamate deiminase [Methylobacterium nodulans]